ncbi:hypothetical protein GCM10027592_22060 [Spirosoma flavus]
MHTNTLNNHLKHLCIALALSVTSAYSQIRLGPPTGSLDGSASLEVESGSYPTGSPFRGLLLPSVNSTQRGQIVAPAKGLMIFNSTSNQVEVNTGTAGAPVWTPGGAVSGGGGGSGWLLTGNAGTSTSNFLGTTDNVPLTFRVNNIKSGYIDPTTFNTAFGYRSQVNTTGSENVSLGYLTLEANTSGIRNTALGTTALYLNTTGSYNTAIAPGSLARNTGGSYNIAIGSNSLPNNLTGNSNMALGVDALAQLSSGSDNVAVGGSALLAQTSGVQNVAIGNLALRQLTNGVNNAALGHNAGENSTSGNFNTFVGAYSGPASGNPAIANSSALGAQAIVNTSNTIVLGNNGITALRCNVQTISSLSDRRIKDNVKANVPGLNFITKLNPVTYNVNKLKEAKLVGYPLASVKEDKVRHSGFIAQDVESAAKAVGYDFEGVKQEENGKYYTVGYTLFVVPLVQAVKELNAEVERLQAKLAKTEKERDSDVAKLQARVAEGETAYNELAAQVKQMQALLGVKTDASTKLGKK